MIRHSRFRTTLFNQSEWVHTFVSLFATFFYPSLSFLDHYCPFCSYAVGWKQQGCRRIEATSSVPAFGPRFGNKAAVKTSPSSARSPSSSKHARSIAFAKNRSRFLARRRFFLARVKDFSLAVKTARSRRPNCCVHEAIVTKPRLIKHRNRLDDARR